MQPRIRRPAAAGIQALLTACVLIIAPSLFAPPVLAVKGVDAVHMTMEDCPSEPGCPAVILVDEHELNNESNRTRYSARRQIKLFTQEGIDEYAQVEIPGVVGGFGVRNLSGRTILPGGRVVKLRNKHVQVKVLRQGGRYMKWKTATFPAIEPGAIIEYSYDVVTKVYTFFNDIPWIIQHEIPVLRSKFTLKQGHFDTAWIRAGTQEVEIQHTHPFENVNYFIAEDVPSLPSEPFGPPPGMIRARQYFGSPGSMRGWLQFFTGQMSRLAGEFMEPDGAIREKTRELTEGRSELSKILEIYRFIQQEIDAAELGASRDEKGDHPEDAGDVLDLGYGDEFERTLLFLSMVKSAGFDHGLLLIVSRDSGILQPEYPDWLQFDAFAAAVKTASGWEYYDPAVKHCAFGSLSAEKENTVTNAALLKSGGGYALITIPHSPSSHNLLKIETSVTLEADGGATLKVSRSGTGQVDLEHRRDYGSLPGDERNEKLAESLREANPGVRILSTQFENLDSPDETARILYEFSLPDLGNAVAGRILVPVFELRYPQPNPFTEEERESDVFLPYARGVRELITIEVPAGYEVDTLPEPEFARDGPFFLTTSYSTQGQNIGISRVLDIDTIHWPVADYDRLRSFFRQITEAGRQAIVLRSSSQ